MCSRWDATVRPVSKQQRCLLECRCLPDGLPLARLSHLSELTLRGYASYRSLLEDRDPQVILTVMMLPCVESKWRHERHENSCSHTLHGA